MAVDMENPANTSPATKDEKVTPGQDVTMVEHVKDVNNALSRTDSYLEDQHVNLGWRTWLVVFVTMFAYASISNNVIVTLICLCIVT